MHLNACLNTTFDGAIIAAEPLPTKQPCLCGKGFSPDGTRTS